LTPGPDHHHHHHHHQQQQQIYYTLSLKEPKNHQKLILISLSNYHLYFGTPNYRCQLELANTKCTGSKLEPMRWKAGSVALTCDVCGHIQHIWLNVVPAESYWVNSDGTLNPSDQDSQRCHIILFVCGNWLIHSSRMGSGPHVPDAPRP
jgi:hypothetical protein